MTDTAVTPSPEAQAPVFQIQRVYLKEASLEQPNSPAILLDQQQPSVDIQLGVEATPVAEGVFEVCVTATVHTKIADKTVFLVECKQGGIFEIRNLPEDQMGPVMGIACPQIVYPYLRGNVADLITRAGGVCEFCGASDALDAVDVAALNARNIPLCIVGDVNSVSVAEHAMMLILACAKQLIRSDCAVRGGPWGWRNKLEQGEVSGKRLLIIGYGRIGRHLARMASAARSAAARLGACGSRRSWLWSASDSGARSEMPTPIRRKGPLMPARSMAYWAASASCWQPFLSAPAAARWRATRRSNGPRSGPPTPSRPA